MYESAVETSALLSTACDPCRLTILTILADGPACVCTFRQHVPVAPNVLSYHLKVLRDAGLVAGRRRGRWVEYALVDGALTRLREAIPALQGQPSRASPCASSASSRTSTSARLQVCRVSGARRHG